MCRDCGERLPTSTTTSCRSAAAAATAQLLASALQPLPLDGKHPQAKAAPAMERIKIPDFYESVTFAAGSRHADNCGSNGLPVTPSSITMIGNFKGYISARPSTGCLNDADAGPTDGSQHLVSYVDCFRNRHGESLLG